MFLNEKLAILRFLQAISPDLSLHHKSCEGRPESNCPNILLMRSPNDKSVVLVTVAWFVTALVNKITI